MASFVNYKQNPLFINIFALFLFRSYFAAHDTDCILLRPAPFANYSRKVCFTNL